MTKSRHVVSKESPLGRGATAAARGARPEFWPIFGPQGEQLREHYDQWIAALDVTLEDHIDLWAFGDPTHSGAHALDRMGQERDALSSEWDRQLAQRAGRESHALNNGEAELGLLNVIDVELLPALLIIMPAQQAHNGSTVASWDVFSLRAAWDSLRPNGGQLFEALAVAMRTSPAMQRLQSGDGTHAVSAEELRWDLQETFRDYLHRARSQSRKSILNELSAPDAEPSTIDFVKNLSGEGRDDTAAALALLTKGQRAAYMQYRTIVSHFPEAEGRPTLAFKLLQQNSAGQIDRADDVKWVRAVGRALEALGKSRPRHRGRPGVSGSVIALDQV